MTPQLETKLGRTDWTYADYLTHGGEMVDAQVASGTLRLSATFNRRDIARAFADMNCPKWKRDAHMAEAKANRAAKFGGDAGYRMGVYGLEKVA